MPLRMFNCIEEYSCKPPAPALLDETAQLLSDSSVMNSMEQRFNSNSGSRYIFIPITLRIYKFFYELSHNNKYDAAKLGISSTVVIYQKLKSVQVFTTFKRFGIRYWNLESLSENLAKGLSFMSPFQPSGYLLLTYHNTKIQQGVTQKLNFLKCFKQFFYGQLLIQKALMVMETCSKSQSVACIQIIQAL